MKVFYKQVQLNPTAETDYTDLVNKPSINGVELEGDLSTEQIKVTWHGTQEEFDALPSHDPYTLYIIDDGTPVGTQDSYLDLADKPSINGQILTGNKVSSDLNMYTSDEVDNIIASMRAIKVVTALPAAPQVNTMYYVGPDSEGVYMVYLFDSLLNRIDLGPSVQKLYTAGHAISINETTSTISVKYDDDTVKTNTGNEIYVPDATSTQKGVVKYDDNIIKVNSEGQLYVVDATDTQKGVVKINKDTIKGTDTTMPVDEAAIQHLTRTLTCAGATDIPANANLNTATYTKPGNYVCGASNASTLTNSPTTSAFRMIVEAQLNDEETAISGNWKQRLRTIKDYSNNGIWTQWVYSNGSGVIYYQNWKKLVVDADYSDTLLDVSGVDSTKVTLSKEALQQFVLPLVFEGDSNATLIPTDGDLNDVAYTAVGSYVEPSATHTVANHPNGSANIAFNLVTMDPIYGDTGILNSTYKYRIQFLLDHNGNMWIRSVRTGNSTTPTFYAWQRIVTANNSGLPEVVYGQGNIDSTWRSLKGNTYGLRAYEARTTNVAGFTGVYTGIDSGANGKIISYELNTTHRGGWVAGKQLFFSNCTADPSVIIDGGFVGNAVVSPKITTKIHDTTNNRYYVDFDTMLDRESGGSGTGWLWNIKQKWTRESPTSTYWFVEFSVFRHGGNVTFHGRGYVTATGNDVAPGICLVTSADPPGLNVREFVIYSN